MVAAIMSGGPAHGRVLEVNDSWSQSAQIVMPVYEPIDITTLGSTERMTAPSFSRADYRVRGRYRCGNPALDIEGRVIYDFVGIS